MHIQPFQAVYPDTGLISSPDHFFSTVKEQFQDYWQSGFYKRLPVEGIYIHLIKTNLRTYKGLVACVDIKDYLDGLVIRHEHTIAASEQEQIRLLLKRSSQVKPVMVTYRPVQEIDDIITAYTKENPYFLDVHFEAQGEDHYFWEIEEGNIIKRLRDLFHSEVPAVYIADGHHRSSSTAVMYTRHGEDRPDNPFRWLPCSFFATPDLRIFDYNRIIEGLNDFSPTSFMAKLSKLFDIDIMSRGRKPGRKHELTMLLNREWYRLRWRKEVLNAYSDQPVILDVNLLNEKVLENILEITDVRTDSRVKYHQGTKDLRGLKNKTAKGDERIAFCLYPISLEDFLTVSEAGGVLPPKSTWFEPRIRSGLLVRRFQL